MSSFSFLLALMAALAILASFFKALAEIINFTEDLGDIQVRYDILHTAETFFFKPSISFSFALVYSVELTLKI